LLNKINYYLTNSYLYININILDMSAANIITIANTTTKIKFNYLSLPLFSKLINESDNIGKNIKVLLPEVISERFSLQI
jgi:hypothetical protein